MGYKSEPDFQTHYWICFFLNQVCQSLIKREGCGKFKYFSLGVPLRVGLCVAIHVVRFALNINFHCNP